MNATEIFEVGDIVEATEDCLKQGLTGKGGQKEGEVTGFSRDKQLIRVRVKGYKTSTPYDPLFFLKTGKKVEYEP
jgi:hypothetical protein